MNSPDNGSRPGREQDRGSKVAETRGQPSGSWTTRTGHQPSAWARRQLRRARRLNRGLDLLTGDQLVMQPIHEGRRAGLCDKCDAPCPEGIHEVRWHALPLLVVTFGLCDPCFQKEGL